MDKLDIASMQKTIERISTILTKRGIKHKSLDTTTRLSRDNYNKYVLDDEYRVLMQEVMPLQKPHIGHRILTIAIHRDNKPFTLGPVGNMIEWDGFKVIVKNKRNLMAVE